MPHLADIASNIDSVRRRIHAAAHRANRLPSEVTLVAVSKTFGPDHVRAAAAHRQTVFGENRVQEAVAKGAALVDLSLEWHLIGHLQSNKARKAVESFAWIQSVDRVELLEKLDVAARDLGRRPSILLQVDLAGESTKHGVPIGSLDRLVERALDARHVDLRGFMIVPPVPDSPDDSRRWFRHLRDIRDGLVQRGIPAERLSHLSMGMSQDFEVAIEEGATLVRVGTSIFGGRAAPT